MHETNEGLRKALHIAFGLCAFSLRFLTWWAAAAVAAIAVIGNWLVLHRVFGRRVARHERGYDAGIVLYPAVVLVLIVVFRSRIEIAGAAWALLAFGDGFATLAGRTVRGARLPWNRDKSWAGFGAFLAFGFVGAEVVFLALRSAPTMLSPLLIVGIATVLAAIVESLPLGVDDNLIIPAVAATSLWALVHVDAIPAWWWDWRWIAVNTGLAIVGYAARSVSLSGLIGGWILGDVLIAFGGWRLYCVLLAFFVIGTAVTKLGYRKKEQRGLAQESGGRRGAGHAFSNVGVSAILAVLSASVMEVSTALWFAGAAALITATADTTASEIGQLIGRRTFLPLSLRPVPVGTEGAISLEGTLAGATAAFAVAAMTSVLRLGAFDLRLTVLLALAGFIGSYLESLAGNWNRKHGSGVPNGALNFFNTAVGAGAFLILLRLG